jgi:hypothetical protein
LKKFSIFIKSISSLTKILPSFIIFANTYNNQIYFDFQIYLDSQYEKQIQFPCPSNTNHKQVKKMKFNSNSKYFNLDMNVDYINKYELLKIKDNIRRRPRGFSEGNKIYQLLEEYEIENFDIVKFHENYFSVTKGDVQLNALNIENESSFENLFKEIKLLNEGNIMLQEIISKFILLKKEINGVRIDYLKYTDMFENQINKNRK